MKILEKAPKLYSNINPEIGQRLMTPKYGTHIYLTDFMTVMMLLLGGFIIATVITKPFQAE